MVLSMTDKDQKERDSAEVGNSSEESELVPSCGFSLSTNQEDDESEIIDVLEKLERNHREDLIVQEALGFPGKVDAKWFDARGQSGPSPADFGDHKPIPIDTVCAVAVVSDPDPETFEGDD